MGVKITDNNKAKEVFRPPFFVVHWFHIVP